MHHVPYTHRLRSGHDGDPAHLRPPLRGRRRGRRLRAPLARAVAAASTSSGSTTVLQRLTYQAGHAEEWRDAVDTYFFRKSGIADDKGRVGAGTPRRPHRGRDDDRCRVHAGRRDAARGRLGRAGGALRRASTRRASRASATPAPPDGANLAVRYFDPSGGVARFKLRVAGQVVDEWRRRRPSAVEQARRPHIVAPAGDRDRAAPRRRDPRRGTPTRRTPPRSTTSRSAPSEATPAAR